MKRLFIFTLFIIIFFTNFNQAYSISPDVFIQSTVNRASQVLSENISREEKISKLKIIAKETVDIQGVGFYSLGSARKNLDDEQKDTYSNLFENYFLKSFSSRLAEYTNPEIEVKNKQILNNNYTIVNSVLIAIKARTIYVKSMSEITANPTCCSTNLEKRIASNEII